MYIKKLLLNNFRNYENQEIEFDENINIIYGDNAQGKTNIIEAIFLGAMGKSFRAKKEIELIKFDEDLAKVEINYKKEDREGKININIADKKTFFINGVKQNKVSDVVGKINVVIFTPDDINIIKDGPSRRRRFLDMMISSLKPNYIHLLNNYNKILEQRNNFLKIYNMNKEENMLDVWDEQLAEYSFKIYEYRKKYIDIIDEKQKDIHKLITESGNFIEKLKIKYVSNGKSKEDFLSNLKKSRKVDLKRGFTSIGIHRDDFIVFLNNKPINVFGSQGQQRTFILTLKLSELKIVEEEIGEKPILLLDDFMSELDEKRRKNFIERIKDNQVIITCTDKIEIEGKQIKSFNIKQGKLN